jgi:putative redox protein
MKNTINVQWTNGMSFESIIDGHKITIDASEEFGGKNLGPRPKALIMMSLAGCTGMDIVSLMDKMRVDYSKFNIKVEGDFADEHPKKYNAIKIVFEVSGKNPEYEKIEKAVKLSEEKYCGVWATLKPGVNISYEIKINLVP